MAVARPRSPHPATGAAPGEVAESQGLGPGAVQLLVPAGRWQCTAPAAEEILVSCVVSPGFGWSGFPLG